MSRCVVNVSFGNGRYLMGRTRLYKSMAAYERYFPNIEDLYSAGCPQHRDIPYAFKAFALREAAKKFDELLWCDASVVPIRGLEPVWNRAREHGAWFSHNGYSNYEWTATSAYPALFPDLIPWEGQPNDPPSSRAAFAMTAITSMREKNKQIPHVVATAFALDLKHDTGAAFLHEYVRLGLETNAFVGPWINGTMTHSLDRVQAPCGPPDVRGHRHDQSAASVLCWRLGIPLSRPPHLFRYGKIEETHPPETCLVAVGIP